MANADERYTSALRGLSDALDPQGIDWAVTGAVAANKYQIPTTTDLDVILTLADNDIEDVQDALRQRGWSTEVVADFLLRAQHPVGGRVDVLVTETDYEAGAIARAHQVSLDEHLAFRTLAVEDVVILKLIADRFQDNADVESIIVAQPDFDWDYMARWFEEFELEGRFQRIENAALASGSLTDKIRRDSGRGDTRSCQPKGGTLA